jgi:hypothetical protein
MSPTIEWPEGANGQTFAIKTSYYAAAAFKAGGMLLLPRSSYASLWLKAGFPLSRFLRRADAVADAKAPRPAVLAWRKRSAPHGRGDAVPDPPAHPQLCGGRRRLAACLGGEEGISPEQAVEAIARIKQILRE